MRPCADLGPGVGRRGARAWGKREPQGTFLQQERAGGRPEQGPPSSSLEGSRSTPHPGRGKGALWKNKTLGWPEICFRETWRSCGLSISSVFFTIKHGVFGGTLATNSSSPTSIDSAPRMRSWFIRVVLGFIVLAMPKDTAHNPQNKQTGKTFSSEMPFFCLVLCYRLSKTSFEWSLNL